MKAGVGDVAAPGGASINGRITTVITDFGGVLTTPLLNSFLALQDHHGIDAVQFGMAMAQIAQRDGENPLFALERGRITELEFLDLLRDGVEPELGHRPELHGFGESFFSRLEPNQPMVELMRELKADGLAMALLTNNVREWEPLWRAMLPVEEIFPTIVDSAFVGHRKPEPEIYRIALERLGNPAPGECLFVDDVDLNCEAARELGMVVVHYQDPDQAITEIRAAVAGSSLTL